MQEYAASATPFQYIHLKTSNFLFCLHSVVQLSNRINQLSVLKPLISFLIQSATVKLSADLSNGAGVNNVDISFWLQTFDNLFFYTSPQVKKNGGGIRPNRNGV